MAALTLHRYTARHKKTAYRGFVSLDVYDVTLSDGERVVETVREVHDHGHGSAILPYDEAGCTCLLVRQMRMPVHVVEGDGHIIEAAAGLIDPEDDGPEDTAVREAGEELGYRVHNPERVATVYPIPGLVTEQISCYLANYSPTDRIEGGGDADEDEVLEVIEWPLARAWQALESGEIRDAKTVILLQALKLRRGDLFKG